MDNLKQGDKNLLEFGAAGGNSNKVTGGGGVNILTADLDKVLSKEFSSAAGQNSDNWSDFG